MKNYFVLMTLAMGVIFSSCELDGGSNYTPTIQLGTYITNQLGDTLKLKQTDEINTLLLDTIYVGDTIKFSMVYNSFANNLVSISIKQSADSLTRIKYAPVDSLNMVFGSKSEYNKGNFVIEKKASIVFLPFKYVAMGKGNEAKLSILVRSDAIFDNFNGSNTAEIIFKTPIQQARK